jgi:hypothetical protein
MVLLREEKRMLSPFPTGLRRIKSMINTFGPVCGHQKATTEARSSQLCIENHAATGSADRGAESYEFRSRSFRFQEGSRSLEQRYRLREVDYLWITVNEGKVGAEERFSVQSPVCRVSRSSMESTTLRGHGKCSCTSRAWSVVSGAEKSAPGRGEEAKEEVDFAISPQTKTHSRLAVQRGSSLNKKKKKKKKKLVAFTRSTPRLSAATKSWMDSRMNRPYGSRISSR